MLLFQTSDDLMEFSFMFHVNRTMFVFIVHRNSRRNIYIYIYMYAIK